MNTDDTNYTLTTTKTLALPGSTYDMKYMDLKSGTTGPVSKDDSTESSFVITFSNPAFSYDEATNTVTVTPANGSLKEETDMVITWKKVALTALSKPIEKTIHLSWSDPEGMRYISFDTQGGSVVAQISAGSGAAITWPAAPGKQGYTFGGWYTNAACNDADKYKGSTTTMPTFSDGTKGMTLYAKWTPAEVNYTVEHYQQELNGTYTLADTERKTGTTGTRTNAAYTADTGFTGKPITQQTIAADGSTVVKVYYDRDTYTVTFKDGVSNANDITQTYRYDAKLAVPRPAREGYTFTGWFTEQTGGTQVFDNTKVTAAATYYAHWTANTNPVTFSSMGGSAVTSVEVLTGQRITKPADPTRTGYTFAGWYSDQNCTRAWNFESDTVTGAMVLYAKWEGTKYTVTFDVNNGNALSSENGTKQVVYGEAYGTLPTPTRTGYGFTGWFTTADGGEQVTAETKVTATAAHTLYAHWQEGAVTYTVKHYQQNLMDDNYTEVTGDEETLSGVSNATTAAAAKSHTGFTAKDFEQQTIAADGSTVVEIKYDRNTYTVTWMNDSTELETDTDVRYGAKPSYNGDTPTKTSTSDRTYRFSGWNMKADGTGNALTDNTIVDANMTFYAQFKGTTSLCTVIFDTDGGPAVASQEVERGQTAAEPAALERTGYEFGGWYTDAEHTSVYDFSTPVTENIQLYAKWKAKEYAITYDLDGGTVADGNPDTYTYGVGVPSFVEPTKDGYTFQGWYNGNTLVTSISESRTGDITLTARWNATAYDIWVAGVQVTEANKDDVLAADPINTGKVSYDPTTQTLTLDGVNITSGVTIMDRTENACVIVPSSVKIHLTGVNTIDLKDITQHNRLCNIYSRGTDGTLTFTGNGSLNLITGPATGISAGLSYSSRCVFDGCTVNITNNQTAGSRHVGIYDWESGGCSLINGASLNISCPGTPESGYTYGYTNNTSPSSCLNIGADCTAVLSGATKAGNRLIIQASADGTWVETADNVNGEGATQEQLTAGSSYNPDSAEIKYCKVWGPAAST